MKEIAITYGWKDMGPQRMSSMMSFTKDNYRMNIYTTTGTITVQDMNKKFDKGETFKNISSEVEFTTLLFHMNEILETT
jgi:hypothetical protein